MEIMETLKDYYYKAQDKYYEFLDFLEAKGVPVYKVVDALDSRNIPSFPIAIGTSVIFLALVVFLLVSILTPSSASLMFNVADSSDAISGAEVKLFYSGEEQTEYTDNEGKVSFRVPLDEQVNYTINKEGYDEESGSRLISNIEEDVFATLVLEITTITKTIQFMDKDGINFISEPIMAIFSCSDNLVYSETKNISNGLTTLELPADCGNLIVDIAGDYDAQNPSVDISGSGTIKIRLSAPEIGTGTANVFVNDEQGDPIPGIEVYLVKRSATGSTLQTIGPKTTTSLGSVSFSSLGEGLYCFTTYDSQGSYAEYDACSANEDKTIEEGTTAEFSVDLTRRSVGMIKIIVKEKSNLGAMDNAEVSLFKDGTLIKSELSDSEGKVEFTIGENVPYDITVDKLGYLIETLTGITQKEDYYQVLLREATLENSRSLKVKVVDERQEPVEDVRVRLMNMEDVQVGDELLTGFDGIAIFDRLDEGTYKVYVSKPGYDEQYSDEITVSGRIENVVELALNIGRGSVEVSVYDDQEQPLPGANVKLIDFASGEERNSRNTNKDGIVVFSERADKTVYALITSPGSSNYTTVPVKITKDITKKLNAGLEKSVSKIEIKEDGIYLGDELLQQPYALNPGQAYTIKLKLYLPEGSAFDEAGIYLRTGADESKSMDKDEIYINDIVAAYDFSRKGTTYNPPLGYSTDLKNLTRSNSKWANAVITKPTSGIYEAEAEIVVKDSAKQQSTLEIHYRGYAKTGGYQRAPADEELGRNESVATRQGLYANTKAIIASVGPSSICNEDFCSSLMMEDMGTKIRTYIIDEYSTEAMGHYKLLLGGIVKQSDGTVSNAELRISDESKGLRLEEYSIKTASGLKKSGNADSTKLAISVGDITKNSVIGGEADGTTSFVAFSPEKAGISKLKISLVSAEGEVVLEKIINVEVSPARELKINVVPKTIVPYIQNNLLIKVFSDDGVTDVEGASVSIIKNGTILDSGVTDSEGIFAYSLVSPEPGSSIRIEVEKTGYKSKALEVVVSENIIETEPSTIEVKFIIGRGHEIESEFVAKNLTLIPLTVESIELTADFRDYVEMSFDESIIGTVMDINSDINVTVLFTLKDKALELEKPKNIEGAIIVKVKNDELVKEWGSNVETIARIGFGDEVDSLDCLSVDPPIWDIIASDDSEKKTIMLVNNCTVDDDPIALTNLQVRIVGQEAETGVLEATSEDGGVGTIELTSVLQKLIGLVEENSENQITFEFTPDVSSGAEELEIEFVGMHYTSRGSEKIKAKVKADIAVSLLAECIQVKPTSMNITSTPYYTGYNNYGNQFSQGYNQYGASNSFDPYSTAAKMGYNYGSDGSNTGGSYSQGYGGYSSYGYNYQNSYPNQSSYANQNYYPQGTDYGSQGQNYAFNWQGAPGKLNIINNCAVDVEISLDHDEGLIPEERTFTVAPNETRELVIESGYAIGLYKIIVNAKAKDSLEAHQKIAEVNVNVESEAVKTYRDCISIDPPNTLKINSFMGKGSYIEVINQCYNEGIRLMENNSGINFPRDAAAYPADPVSDIKNIIGNWSYVSTDYDSTSDGKVVQKVTYRIIKSTKYVEDAPSFPDSGENPMQSIGGIRYFLTRGYYAINADTMMQVSFHTRTGEKKSISFPMTVEDLWQALDYAANTIKFGDPKYTPEQCVGDNINALTFSEYGDCIPYEELKNVFEKNIIKIARRDNRGDEVDGCGWMDRISEISKTTFENSGLQANLSLDEEGHSIKVRITGWEGKEYIPRTTISGETRITFKRAFYRTDKTKIPLKVSMTICEYGSKPGDDNGTTPITEVKCPEGETGSAVFKKYGFDKLQLDWKWNSITKDSCDTGMFCDAAQFGIALNKKMEKLNEIVDDVRPAKDSCTVADPSKCACAAPEQSSCANEFKNSKELFRWALESFKVFDDAAGKNLVFFRGTGEDLVVVDNDALDKIKEKVGTVTGSTDWTYILDTQTKLEAIKVLLDKESLLILLHTDKLTGYATEKGAFGIEQVKIGNTEYLVMTFNEYYEMHTRIKTVLAGMANKETETEVTVKTLSNADVKIEAAFLNEFNKARATVVIGILAKNDISTEDKETAMKEGVVKDGVDLQGYTNLLDLYKDLVEFDAYLIKDGYSADYRKDFTATYTQDIPKIGVDFNNWVFKVNGTENGALADAVLAGIAVDYDWSVQDKNALTIEIKKSKTLSEIQGSSNKYTMNALFQMPFDGELGYADKKREGYGTGYTAGGDIAENFFINYDNTTENLPLKSIANGLETTKASRSTTYDVSSSKILQINNKNLVFSPVDPIYIVANLSKTGSTEYAAGLVYYLKVGAKNYTGNSILNWKLGADTISGKSGILADAPMRVSTICEGQGNEELLGVAFNGKKSGNVSMNSIIYVPTAIDPANESQLIFSCIKDRLTATAKDVTAIKTTNLSGTSLGLNTDTKKGAIKVKEDYNLKKLADNINSEKVCVASDESGLGFYWNPAKVN